MVLFFWLILTSTDKYKVNFLCLLKISPREEPLPSDLFELLCRILQGEMLTHFHAPSTGPGAWCSSTLPTPAARGALSPALQPLLLGEQLAQRASVSPGTWLHVWMLTLLMARLQHSNERNNVCFDQFDNSFKSIVPEPWRQKATPLLHAGTVSLCEVIETCGNNI